MDIYFRTRKMEKACGSERAMNAEWGEKRAKKIRQRLSEFRAADTLADIATLPGPRCHELAGKLDGHLSVDLDHPFRLIFAPEHTPLPTKADGGLDWSAVTAIEVCEIKDTH